jgi:hypothetical protein
MVLSTRSAAYWGRTQQRRQAAAAAACGQRRLVQGWVLLVRHLCHLPYTAPCCHLHLQGPSMASHPAQQGSHRVAVCCPSP